MRLVEEMVSGACLEINGSYELDYGDEIGIINLKPPWKRIELKEAILEFSGFDFMSLKNIDELSAKMKEMNIHVEPNSSWASMIDKVISDKVEPNLIQPTFLIDYPVEMSPLAKRKFVGGDIVERFEAFVMGSELANAFSELNDPIDQRERFEAQAKLGKAGDDEAHPVDENFLQAIECGMPPTGGVGIGIDRLVMLLTENLSIKDVILFPAMRKED